MNNYRIAAVVVTYNRKEQLLDCLNAIANQTFKPAKVFIIDNASSDGSEEMIAEHGYNNQLVRDIQFVYVRLKENVGGAGGFYAGIKMAYEDEADFDAVWVMDDDGVPESDQLHYLAYYLGGYDYIAPLVIAIENDMNLSFPYKGISKVEDLRQAYSGYEVVKEYACPFNGILYSRRLIERIGFPIPGLFIWGDEENYHFRALKAGFHPVTVLRALHRHPANKSVMVQSVGDRQIVFVPQKWKAYCHYRNRIFNMRQIHHASVLSYIKVYLTHVYFFLFEKKSLSWFWCYNDAFFSGIMGRLDGHRKYMTSK